MRLTIIAAGRIKGAPEGALFETYQTRLKSAPASLGPLTCHEIDERKSATHTAHAYEERLNALSGGATLIALDERGAELSTRALADKLSAWRDQSIPEIAFVIGPADGLPPAIKSRASFALRLGALTWPHLLVRAMLAEQLYRAASLLSGHPYHRE